ncbi:MAG: xanthine phosphoribosyltransferase [Fusobacteria bacterium]|nr:xanthine phosphoribosyltransferase [Fusobacteriota bacterium]
MKLLKERILKDGRAAGEGILKVDTFLNHQIDPELMEKIGEEFYEKFKDKKITKILTIEASGIAIAVFVAKAFGVPLVFAKKTLSKNMDGEILSTSVMSYTKGLVYIINVAKKFINKDDNILLIDDFLANGSALLGLAEIVQLGGADLAGAGIVIEKSYQPGRKRAEAAGIDVCSLVEIEEIKEGKVVFKEEN